MFPNGPSNSWRNNLKQAKLAMQQGRLEKAVQIVRRDRLHQHRPGVRLINTLVDELLSRASQRSIAGKFSGAWNDLSAVDEIAQMHDRQRIAQRFNVLIEMTIQQAETFLTTARPDQALNILLELHRRGIADRRADQIMKVASSIAAAKRQAAQGNFKQAKKQIQLAKSLRPDLQYLEKKLSDYQNNRIETKRLTRQLREDLLGSRWHNAKQVSGRLLKIAPDYRIALDALKRCFGKAPVTDPAADKPNQETKQEPLRVNQEKQNRQHQPNSEIRKLTPAKLGHSFLLWVDGTGGFLVCTSPEIIVGQAVEQSRIDVPIMGDLRRRHLKMELVDDHFAIEPWGPLAIDDKPIAEKTLLKNEQVLNLGGGVQIKYDVPHPLSSTARLELISRHRTQPWSDAVILMADSIVLGPRQTSHIRCPEFSHDVVIFQRDGQLFVRGNSELEIDGKICIGHHPITTDSRIAGDDFAISLETI